MELDSPMWARNLAWMAGWRVYGDKENEEERLAFPADWCIHVCTHKSPRVPLTNLVRVWEGDSLYPPSDLDPIELSDGEELSLPLGSRVATTCSVQGLPAPALRWTKVRGKEDPAVGPPPSHHLLPFSHRPPGLFSPPAPYRTQYRWWMAPHSHSAPSPSIRLAPTYVRPTCPRSPSSVAPRTSSCWLKVWG